MRVLSVGNLYPPASMGGYELVWSSWVEHMRSRGADVRVLTSDHRAAEVEAIPGVERALRLYWADHEFPRVGWRERIALERHNAEVLDGALADGADAVVWWAMGGMSLSLLERVRRRGVPAVGVVCDDWMLYGPKVDAWARAFAGRRLAAAAAERLTGLVAGIDVGRAAHWLFLSETVRRRAIEGGIEPGNSEICNRGADEGLFRPAPPREWGWRLAYLGRIDERKGIETAIEALAALPEATLRVDGAGDERHAAELRELAARSGVGERVEFAQHAAGGRAGGLRGGGRDRLPRSLGRAVGAGAARGDGRRPAGDRHRARGLGRVPERSRQLPPLRAHRTPRALAAAVRELAGDAGLRERLVERGFETAVRFSERAFNEQIERAVEREAERSGGEG